MYAFDGTWNDSTAPDSERDPKTDTNVHLFRVLYDGHKEYVNGVGSRKGFLGLGKYIGGATGAGKKKRIKEQFAALKSNYRTDPVIDIVGYSRGAAIARMFIDHIDEHFKEIEDIEGPLKVPPPVRFLGLFDTVGSFGVPWTDNEHGFKREIPKFVENTFHAMAIDETRETFGIERCIGDREKITEVWFRGGHGDIGGNATYTSRGEILSNRVRSNIALRWMYDKAKACGIEMKDWSIVEQSEDHDETPPVTALDEAVSIGKAGTLSRRIHLGDLVHHTMEETELTRGFDGRQLRRIDVLTRVEDAKLQNNANANDWIPPMGLEIQPDNFKPGEPNPSIEQLSLRRYPFDVLPARTWAAWFELWDLEDPGIDSERRSEFWAPNTADKALAWEIYVELQTRITTQVLNDDEGDDVAALTSIYELFPKARKSIKIYGTDCSNAATLITLFLNQRIRDFTTKWHGISVREKWKESEHSPNADFREDLVKLRPDIEQFARALSQVADATLS
ncbi:MAG: DUF2235 domain-containing protein [Pseudomonadota bacterium]